VPWIVGRAPEHELEQRDVPEGEHRVARVQGSEIAIPDDEQKQDRPGRGQGNHFERQPRRLDPEPGHVRKQDGDDPDRFGGAHPLEPGHGAELVERNRGEEREDDGDGDRVLGMLIEEEAARERGQEERRSDDPDQYPVHSVSRMAPKRRSRRE